MAVLLLKSTGSIYFSSAESGIYCWKSQRFLFPTPLKTRVKTSEAATGAVL